MEKNQLTKQEIADVIEKASKNASGKKTTGRKSSKSKK